MRFAQTLGTNWRFSLGDHDNAWLKSYDDSSWRRVTVPHDWSVENPFSIEHSSGTGYLPGGVAYYRRAFRLEESMRGKTVTLTFDGVYNNASVWINSYYLGGHPYGYSEFSFDITPFCSFGDDENVVVVKVAHRDLADSRWFTGSGIYRKVTVTAQNPLHIAQHSPFVWTEASCAEAASVRVRTEVVNAANEAANVTVEQTLLDARGAKVACASEEISVGADGCACVEQALSVEHPALWSPDAPNLYTCVTTLRSGGEAADETQTVTGIRSFVFDADKGFSLNGVGMKLKGVCVHHDAGCLGAAVRPKVWRRRLNTLKKLGCNAIRMSHNPHMPELYDLCDELGFFVIDEAFDEWEGAKNKWSTGHNVYPPRHYGYFELFPQWHECDLSTMVRRDRNHPSIIMWSIGNEIDYPNDPYCHPYFNEMAGNNDSNKPKQEQVYNPAKPNAERLVVTARKLKAIVKEHDVTRPVTAALAFPELSTRTGLNEVLDVTGYNYKEHLYGEDHKRFPLMPLLGSENGKMLGQWVAVEQNEYISGQFLWTGIDFLGETRGWPSHGSKAGLLDMAGFKKPSADFRAALWCDTPVAALYTRPVARREENVRDPYMLASWDYPAETETDILCFTNCAQAELFLDGKSLGVRKLAEAEGRVLCWTAPYQKGVLKAIATAGDGTVVEALLEPVGAPCAVKLEVCDEQLCADGLDMTHIVATVVDACGRRVPSAENTLFVDVQGGCLLGMENGYQEDTQPYALPYRRANGGHLMVYVGAPETAGTITVKVTAETLVGAEVTITAD